jgi:Mrp family chromosome partitioning ATPase
MIKLSKNKILSNSIKYFHSTLRDFNKFSLYRINSQSFGNKLKISLQSSTKISNKYREKNEFYKTKTSPFSITQLNKDILKSVINQVKTEEGKSIIDLDLLYDIKFDPASGKTKILINLHKDFRKIKILLENKIKATPELSNENVEISMAPQEKKSEPTTSKKIGLKKVKHVIAVSSCKGGVGKSTVAVNLAFSLMQRGKKVGIFDADVYGPSLPTMISPKDSTLRSYEDSPEIIIPIEFSGIKAMSFGFAAPGRRAVMRGPIVSNLVTQLVCNTDWGELDYLVIDMPPGTGDIQISLCQELNFTGGVVITTPQKLSFIDVVKGIEMFDELKIPVLAVIENMSYFLCDSCDKKHNIFGNGYVNMLKKQFGIEDSYNLPIDPMVSRVSDLGSPYVLVAPETSQVQSTFKEISEKLIEKTDNIVSLIKNKPRVEYSPKDEAICVYYGDDQVKKINTVHLRKKCMCAACIDEFTGEKILKEKSIPNDVHPKRLEEKGNYAVAIVWSDGHRSSIYPYKRLLSDEISSI